MSSWQVDCFQPVGWLSYGFSATYPHALHPFAVNATSCQLTNRTGQGVAAPGRLGDLAAPHVPETVSSSMGSMLSRHVCTQAAATSRTSWPLEQETITS
jgi:hypothetical protein